MKKIAYYPGCSLTGMADEFDVSTRALCKKLDVELIEIPDWNCCGSTPSHSFDPMLGATLSGRNIAIAESLGLDEVMSPCPSCVKSLKTAIEVFQEQPGPFQEVLGRSFSGNSRIVSVVQLLYETIGPESIKNRVVRPLAGKKIVPYYGCILTRPPELAGFDDPENPVSIDELLVAIGAQVPQYPYKTECCGAAYGPTRNKTVMQLSGRLLDMAERTGADAIAVACPLCQQNLDLRQSQINRFFKKEFGIPVIYITQLVGFALGIDKRELGVKKLFTGTGAVFN